MILSRSYVLGLVFIVAVALLWAASSVLTQYLYQNQSFTSPFLLTYIGVSLFTLWLPTKCLTSFIQDIHRSNCKMRVRGAVALTAGSDEILTYRDDGTNDDCDAHQDLTLVALQTRSEEPNSNIITTASNVHEDDNSRSLLVNVQHWTNEDHIRAALKIAPVWFLANWTYNASLEYTSITSSTVLASTGSLFTFLFAVVLKDENFSLLKLAGVVLGFSGSVITALNDVSPPGGEDDSKSGANACDGSNISCTYVSLFGDVLGLISAIGYGGYAVQTRVLCPHDETLYSMQLLLGYIGLTCGVVLFPIAIWQWGIHAPTSLVLGCLVIKGLFDNVISDYLWLRAVILTSATVATVGLGLTIPLAFLSDLWKGNAQVVSLGSIAGAISVLAGFVLVNMGNQDTHPVDDDDSERENLRTIQYGNRDDAEEQEVVSLRHRPYSSEDEADILEPL